MRENKGGASVWALTFFPPRNDVIFKLFFADERNMELLTDFLQSVLDIPADDYDVLSIIDPHLLREYPDDKMGIIDVKLKTKSGKVINVEIQVAPMPQMRERVIYYDAKMIAEQLGSGSDYKNIKRVISIIITDYKLITESPNYHHCFVLYDRENGVTFSNTLQIHTLELPKLPDNPDGTPLWNWMSFLDAQTEEDLHMTAETSPIIKKAVVRLIKLSADERARALYEAREKERRDNRAREQGAWQEGRRDGMLDVARNLLQLNRPIPEIVKVTNLTQEEVEGLLQ
jgi:predicted transposase/invertase (TIGR01784 family)